MTDFPAGALTKLVVCDPGAASVKVAEFVRKKGAKGSTIAYEKADWKGDPWPMVIPTYHGVSDQVKMIPPVGGVGGKDHNKPRVGQDAVDASAVLTLTPNLFQGCRVNKLDEMMEIIQEAFSKRKVDRGGSHLVMTMPPLSRKADYVEMAKRLLQNNREGFKGVLFTTVAKLAYAHTLLKSLKETGDCNNYGVVLECGESYSRVLCVVPQYVYKEDGDDIELPLAVSIPHAEGKGFEFKQSGETITTKILNALNKQLGKQKSQQFSDHDLKWRLFARDFKENLHGCTLAEVIVHMKTYNKAIKEYNAANQEFKKDFIPDSERLPQVVYSLAAHQAKSLSTHIKEQFDKCDCEVKDKDGNNVQDLDAIADEKFPCTIDVVHTKEYLIKKLKESQDSPLEPKCNVHEGCYVPFPGDVKNETLKLGKLSPDDQNEAKVGDGKAYILGKLDLCQAPEALFEDSGNLQSMQKIAKESTEWIVANFDMAGALTKSFANVTLAGGTTKLPNFGKRLEQELKKVFPAIPKINIAETVCPFEAVRLYMDSTDFAGSGVCEKWFLQKGDVWNDDDSAKSDDEIFAKIKERMDGRPAKDKEADPDPAPDFPVPLLMASDLPPL